MVGRQDSSYALTATNQYSPGYGLMLSLLPDALESQWINFMMFPVHAYLVSIMLYNEIIAHPCARGSRPYDDQHISRF